MESQAKDLIDRLQCVKKQPDLVCMHDFFLDHFAVYLGDRGSVSSYVRNITNLARQGGGVIPYNKQYILCGGNAFNSSITLATLGATAHIICRTSPLGLHLMEYFTKEKPIDLSHVKTDGELAVTVALELKHKNRLVNPMLNYPGSVDDFGFDNLEQDDLDLILKTDYIIVSDWHLNFKGTDLARRVFRHAKKGRCMKFFDPGEPMLRKNEIRSLMEDVILEGNIDVLGLNESEACWFATYFEPEYEKRMKREPLEQLAVECCRLLRKHLSCRLDLHTTTLSASFDAEETFVPAFDVHMLRATGAGDTWNAADTYGEAIGLSPSQRLLFANAAAAYYISSPTGDRASKEQIADFIKKSAVKQTNLLY
jgi:sugar/nucleoside kinase (ribokinase family)